MGVIRPNTQAKSKKKYTISFEFEDDKGKKHRASVRFGLRDKKYLVDSGDQETAKIFS